MTTLYSLDVVVAPDEAGAGAAAGKAAADAIARAIAERGHARVIFASAPSQQAMLDTLVAADIDWGKVHAFHMDEYIGIDPADPRAFATWLADRLPVDAMAGFERIDSHADPDDEARRYEACLRQAPIDVTCMGFGVNGHLAFNEPGADLADPRLARPVVLTHASRQQQVTDGLFATVDDTPTHAVSLTVPALLSARTVISTVIGAHKADAVAAALRGPYTSACPASAIRFHADASLFIDEPAAAGLGAAPEA